MWKLVSACAVGTAHLDINLPCQDACRVELIKSSAADQYLLCLAADGAGSAKAAEIGAQVACETARDCILAWVLSADSLVWDASMVEVWINDIRSKLLATAVASSLTLRDFACTLLGAVIGPDKAVFFQIGDGAMVAASGDVQGVVFWPAAGLYANMTYFVTDDEAVKNLHVLITDSRIDELAVFTDGLQRLALSFEQCSPHSPFFEPMFKVLRKQTPGDCEALNVRMADFLQSPAINSRTDDDKTLILASRRAE
jgi:hypothetical protein